MTSTTTELLLELITYQQATLMSQVDWLTGVGVLLLLVACLHLGMKLVEGGSK